MASSASVALRIPTLVIQRSRRLPSAPGGGASISDLLSVHSQTHGASCVRVETVSPEIARMASSGEDAADAKSLADALTANERAAVEALESFGVIGGVENGRSGTMAFALMDDARVKKGPDGRKYYVFSYETEVCRAKIEEGMGGSKICVGPQGDVLDSIQRRSRVVVTFVGNRVVKLHASAVSSRFDEVEEIMNRAVDSFALNVV